MSQVHALATSLQSVVIEIYKERDPSNRVLVSITPLGDMVQDNCSVH